MGEQADYSNDVEVSIIHGPDFVGHIDVPKYNPQDHRPTIKIRPRQTPLESDIKVREFLEKRLAEL